MKVMYKTVLAGDKDKQNPERIWDYEQQSIEDICCPEMKEALGDEALNFGENAEPTFCLSRCYPYPEGACYDYYSIKFCPFCSEAIEYIEAKRTRYKEVKRIIPEIIGTDIVEEDA